MFHPYFIYCINMKTVAGLRARNERPVRASNFQSQYFWAYVSQLSKSLPLPCFCQVSHFKSLNWNVSTSIISWSYTHVPLLGNLVYCKDVHVLWELKILHLTMIFGLCNITCPNLIPKIHILEPQCYWTSWKIKQHICKGERNTGSECYKILRHYCMTTIVTIGLA